MISFNQYAIYIFVVLCFIVYLVVCERCLVCYVYILLLIVVVGEGMGWVRLSFLFCWHGF